MRQDFCPRPLGVGKKGEDHHGTRRITELGLIELGQERSNADAYRCVEPTKGLKAQECLQCMM